MFVFLLWRFYANKSKKVDCDSVIKICINWALSRSERVDYLKDLLSHPDVDKCSHRCLDSVVNTNLVNLLSNADIKLLMSRLSYKHTVAVIGGWDDYGLQSQTFTINTQDGSVTKSKLPGLLVRNEAARCVTSEGLLFSAGGGTRQDKYEHTKEASLFNPYTHEVVTRLPDLPVPVRCAAAVCVGDRVYVLGGEVTERMMLFIDLRYDKTWRRLPDMPMVSYCPMAWAVGDEIFILADMHLQSYNTVNGEWSLLSSPAGRTSDTYKAFIVPVRKDVYLIGGEDRVNLRYTYADDAWEVLSQPEQDHCGGSGVYIDGKIYISGGYDQVVPDVVTLVEEYDIATDTWRKSWFKLPKPLIGHFTFAL